MSFIRLRDWLWAHHLWVVTASDEELEELELHEIAENENPMWDDLRELLDENAED